MAAVPGNPGPPPPAHTLIPYGDPPGLAPLPVGALWPPPGTGQFIGTDQAEAIVQTARSVGHQELFFLREPEIRPERLNAGWEYTNGTTGGSLRNDEAWIGQMVGYPPPNGDCTRCANQNGPFTRCMVMPT